MEEVEVEFARQASKRAIAATPRPMRPNSPATTTESVVEGSTILRLMQGRVGTQACALDAPTAAVVVWAQRRATPVAVSGHTAPVCRAPAEHRRHEVRSGSVHAPPRAHAPTAGTASNR